MRDLKRRSMSDELCPLLPSTKNWQRDVCWWTRSQATTHQRASVVIVANCVRSNRNDITCRPMPSSRVEMLAARADFPTPGDPLIHITLWLLALLTLFLISYRIVCRVPSMHDLRRGSLFPPRALTKSIRNDTILRTKAAYGKSSIL